MMMEADAEEIEHVFIAHEIDLDYEFDAPRFFDFSRPETPVEAHQAQLWFQNAATYPPSPFVPKLVVRDSFLLVNVGDSSQSKHLQCTNNVDDDGGNSSVPLEIEFCSTFFDNNVSKTLGGKISGLLGGTSQNDAMQLPQLPSGLTFCSKTISHSLNSKAKSAVPEKSTLMKPTASQLAKQNHHPKNVGSRFQTHRTQNERNLSISSGLESQAPKRQKLEGGVLCKATDVKQQTNFFHKAPKTAVMAEQNSTCSKLKLTIPRAPDLKTAHRAQRIRPKNIAESEHLTAAAPRFKARPLNRKILNAPSMPLPKRSAPRLPEFQEFHLKTGERAMQHTSATSSSSLHCNDSDNILSSKGDFGVFQNSKSETRDPMEFNLHTEKGVQHHPPIELFSKLSLTSEVQPNFGSHLKLPQHSGTCRKEKPFMFGAKQIHHGNGGCISETATLLSARRSLGIR